MKANAVPNGQSTGLAHPQDGVCATENDRAQTGALSAEAPRKSRSEPGTTLGIITRRSLAKALDEFDQMIDAAQRSKRAAYDLYRAQLQADGMSRVDTKEEIAAFKKATTRVRATPEERRSIEKVQDLEIEIYNELIQPAGMDSATRSARREVEETKSVTDLGGPNTASHKPAEVGHQPRQDDREAFGGDGSNAASTTPTGITGVQKESAELGAARNANSGSIADTASGSDLEGARLRSPARPSKIRTASSVDVDTGRAGNSVAIAADLGSSVVNLETTTPVSRPREAPLEPPASITRDSPPTPLPQPPEPKKWTRRISIPTAS